MKTLIVKRYPRQLEPYDESKLYASIYASCLSVRTPQGEAALTADRVCRNMLPWLHEKSEVTSKDIRLRATEHLQVYNPHAAYMYKYLGAIN